MRRILLAALVGAVAVAPALAQPPYYQQERDRDYDQEHARGVSRQSRELVTNWFVHFFNQQPDFHSLVVWAGQVDQTGKPEQVLARMLGETTYYDLSGDTPEGFVHKLFRDLTGREPSRREFDAWMDRLARAGGRAPDVEDRTNLAYEMLKRYPPASERDRDRDDDYDYRRPDRLWDRR